MTDAEKLVARVIHDADNLNEDDYPEPVDSAEADRMAVQVIVTSICSQLGITPEMVADFHHAKCGFDHQGEYDCVVCEVTSALSTLLEVAGVQTEVNDG